MAFSKNARAPRGDRSEAPARAPRPSRASRDEARARALQFTPRPVEFRTTGTPPTPEQRLAAIAWNKNAANKPEIEPQDAQRFADNVRALQR